MCRRCGERDRRGNAADRRARKRWLLETFGDGTSCPCFWCETRLTFVTLQQDRLVAGGPYRRDNLVPACAACNLARTAAGIPDGCHFGPVGDLTTDRHGRYLDEPPPVATSRGPQSLDRSPHHRPPEPHPGPEPGVPTNSADSEGPTMRFPRAHRSTRRATPAPAHRRHPRTLDRLTVQHAVADKGRVDDPWPESEPEPGPVRDAVVIDTASLDELRAEHPWLFARHRPAEQDDAVPAGTDDPDGPPADLRADDDGDPETGGGRWQR